MARTGRLASDACSGTVFGIAYLIECLFVIRIDPIGIFSLQGEECEDALMNTGGTC